MLKSGRPNSSKATTSPSITVFSGRSPRAVNYERELSVEGFSASCAIQCGLEEGGGRESVSENTCLAEDGRLCMWLRNVTNFQISCSLKTFFQPGMARPAFLQGQRSHSLKYWSKKVLFPGG